MEFLTQARGWDSHILFSVATKLAGDLHTASVGGADQGGNITISCFPVPPGVSAEHKAGTRPCNDKRCGPNRIPLKSFMA